MDVENHRAMIVQIATVIAIVRQFRKEPRSVIHHGPRAHRAKDRANRHRAPIPFLIPFLTPAEREKSMR